MNEEEKESLKDPQMLRSSLELESYKAILKKKNLAEAPGKLKTKTDEIGKGKGIGQKVHQSHRHFFKRNCT